MANMSFYATTWQFVRQIKTVTRRQGWPNLKAGDRVMGIEKGQGLKKGEKVKRLGEVDVRDERWERIDRMITEPAYGREEVIKEGFPEMTPEQFVAMYCKMNRVEPAELCHRIAFDYVVKRTDYSFLDGRPCPHPDCVHGSISQISDLNCELFFGLEAGYDHANCPYCDGDGTISLINSDTCPDCGGAGVVDEPLVAVAKEQMALL